MTPAAGFSDVFGSGSPFALGRGQAIDWILLKTPHDQKGTVENTTKTVHSPQQSRAQSILDVSLLDSFLMFLVVLSKEGGFFSRIRLVHLLSNISGLSLNLLFLFLLHPRMQVPASIQ
jgi:hypothetical protein